MSKISTQCMINALAPKLQVTKEPLYEHMTIWAEESSQLRNNSAQWSFGNGSTGYLGLAIAGDGWEIEELTFHADQFAANARCEIALCDYTTNSNAASNILATIEVNGSTDGFGQTDNAAKVFVLPSPVAIPNPAILGFRTITASGTISDCRVATRLRRKVGEFVTDVKVGGN